MFSTLTKRIKAMTSFKNIIQINQFESQVFELTNQIRRKSRLSLLRWNHQLIAVAQNHSRDMAKNGRMSHTGSDNSKLRLRAERTGYRGYLGENVAWGQRTPEEVINSWMNSSGHRSNILNPNYKEIGVGYLNGYWTQVFGSRR